MNNDKNIGEYTSKGRAIKASAGGYSGGRAPYGYASVKGALIVNESEARWVRLIFNLRAEGTTYKNIAAKLELTGCVSRGGKPMLFTTVKSILDNEQTYHGKYKYGKNEWVDGQQEAIL